MVKLTLDESLRSYLGKKRIRLEADALSLPEAFSTESYNKFAAIKTHFDELNRLDKDFLAHRNRPRGKDEGGPIY